MQKLTALLLIICSALLITVSLSHIRAENELERLKKHPTYHCDGSATMGYAVPGTPEAAACWIEENK